MYGASSLPLGSPPTHLLRRAATFDDMAELLLRLWP